MKKNKMIFACMITGLFLPITINAENNNIEETQDKFVLLSVTDPEGNFLKDTKIALFDSTDSENPINQWTIDEEAIQINNLLEDHTYIIRETEVPEGYYFASDRSIQSNEETVTLVNSKIDLQIRIIDHFEREAPISYPLQILDTEGEMISEITVTESGSLTAADTSKMKADSNYILHADTEMYFPDKEFEITRYDPEKSVEAIIDYRLVQAEIEVVNKNTGEYLPDVTLQVKDPYGYITDEIMTEKPENEDDNNLISTVNLIENTEYLLHVSEVPDYFIIPEDQVISCKNGDDGQKKSTIELIPYRSLLLYYFIHK